MIIKSAIMKDSIIYLGKRHSDIINSLEKGFLKNAEQGFITETGDFLTRTEALEHAYRCGQISKELYESRMISKDLFSEDLW